MEMSKDTRSSKVSKKSSGFLSFRYESSKESLVGRVATITLGTAKHGHPAEAKVKDQHDQTHYLMVEPDALEQEFAQGTKVLLVRKQGAVFYVINIEHDALNA